MFGGICAAGADRLIYVTADGNAVFVDVETANVVGQFGRSPLGPDQVHVSACAVDADGAILLADARNHCVRRFAPDGRPLARYGARANPGIPRQDEAGVLEEPCAIEPVPGGLLVACGGSGLRHGLQFFDVCGTLRGCFEPPGGIWQRAQGLALRDEEIWVAETEAHAIQRLRSDGSFLGRIVVPEEVGPPFRLRNDGYGGVLAVCAPMEEGDQERLGVGRFDGEGYFEGWVVEAGEDPGRVYCPFDLAVLPDGRFVVADLPFGEPPDVRLQLFSADGRLLRALFEDLSDLQGALTRHFEDVLAGAGSLCQQARIHHHHAGGSKDHALRAEDLYRAALREDPHLLLAHVELGRLLQEVLDEPEAAEDAYREALALGGDAGDLLARIAECRHARGDLDGAIGILESAVTGPVPPEEYHRRVEELGSYYLERAGETW